MPLPAVSADGMERVSSGSQTAAPGSRCGLKNPSLSPLSRVSRAARPTSLPLPAVVGTATSGGGQNFGTDLASLAAEAQSFVDSFNGLQDTIANINNAGSLLGGNIPGAAGLVTTLNSQALATYANGSSTLTKLSQLGITFEPTHLFGGGNSLRIDLDTLESAFNADATGAFSLLSNVASKLGNVANSFVGQTGSAFATFGALGASLARNQFLTNNLFSNNLFSQTQFNDDFNFTNLLALGSLSQSGFSGTNMQAFLALNRYNLISQLLG